MGSCALSDYNTSTETNITTTETETTREPDALGTGDWEKNFPAAVTHELYAAAIRYASTRAKQIEAVGGRIDDLYVRDLVQGVIVDTFTEKLAWDPARCSLEQHVIRAIKSRSRHDREAVPHEREVPFDIHDRSRDSLKLQADVERALDAQRIEDTARDCAADRV